MGRLTKVREMFASAWANLKHVENLVMGALFPIGTRLSVGEPFTFGEYALAYAAGILIIYSFDFVLRAREWAVNQIDDGA